MPQYKVMKMDSKDRREYNRKVFGVDSELDLEHPEVAEALKRIGWNGEVKTWELTEMSKKINKEAPTW